MIDALLVINEFLKAKKYDEIHAMLVSAFAKKGVALEVRTNAELLPILCENERKYEKYKFALFFDKDILLAEYLEKCGLRLFNSSSAIAVCDDKRQTAIRLNGLVKMPKTIIAPMTFDNIGYTNYDFLDYVVANLKFPIVVKEAFGSFGQQVYLVHDIKKLEERVKSSSTKLLFQEFIASSFGKDIRLQVVGGKVIASMLRMGAKDSFISNVTSGGTMTKVKAKPEYEEMAIKSCKALNVDFAGVDVLIGNDGEPILCEVNSNAHLKNLYEACGIDASEHIADYILKTLCL